MAFTRFNYDDARTRRIIEESTFEGRYMLNTPGPGVGLPFYEDPQLRLQKWGANLSTENSIDVESKLMGLNYPFGKDNLGKSSQIPSSQFKHYPSSQPMVEESRASHPAWTYKSLEQSRWEEPFLNPQANLEKGFHENIQTRILEKDYFVPTIPVLGGVSKDGSDSAQYYLTGRTMCLG